jgi:hypothetical protein
VNEPEEFVGGMDESAVAQHEMYMSWVRAGFTPDQALDLVKSVIREIFRRNDDD